MESILDKDKANASSSSLQGSFTWRQTMNDEIIPFNMLNFNGEEKPKKSMKEFDKLEDFSGKFVTKNMKNNG